MTSRNLREAILFPPIALVSLIFSACANHHFSVPAEGPPTDIPTHFVLLSDKQVATLHFPAGTYTFYARDDAGYYYRAPRKIIQHHPGGSQSHSGGVFVSKRDRKKIRGYIFLAGGLTHVGDLSRARYQFEN